MSILKSTLGKTLPESEKNNQIHIEGPSYDEYDILVVSRNKIDYSEPHELSELNTVLHKTLMIKEKYLKWASKLVGDKLTRKNAGLGSILSTLVHEYHKEKLRKQRMLSKMKDCFELVINDTELMISNRKHGRISQYEHYQKRANKGRMIFKRMYYEYGFEDSDLLEIFTKDELRQIKTWIISSEDNFSQALHTWTETYKKTSKKKIWNH